MTTVVVPTLGRPSLRALLDALAPQRRDGLEVLVVDDRPDGGPPLDVPAWVRVLRGPAAGPAAARNVGWRAAADGWVAFLDDDVLPDPDWVRRLAADVEVPARVGGVQGRVRVPLPAGRRPTDWERVTAGLASGRWITADMAYRRAALEAVGGFDERFPRAFREDAEVAYRVRAAGWELAVGARSVVHPVRAESPWVSLRMQRGNADDALLRRMYGPGWRRLLEVPPGRRRRHVAVTAAGACGAAGLVAAGLAVSARWRAPVAGATGVAVAGWVAGTAEFAWARIAPGPRTPREVAIMLADQRRHPSTGDRRTGCAAGGRPGARGRAGREVVDVYFPGAAGTRLPCDNYPLDASPRCCSTATARWSRTCPTTAIRTRSARFPAPGSPSTGCARPACASAW